MKRSQLKRTPFKPKPRGYSWGLKRSRMRVRKYSKRPTEDGASLRELKDEMDSLVREIIALRDHKCINFGCRETEGLHVGHYIKRGVLALRWDLRNCNAQCDPCNEAHNVDRWPYRKALILQHGLRVIWQMEELAQQKPRLTYVEMVAIRDGLRAKKEALGALREAA